VRNRCQAFAFKCNVYRYVAVGDHAEVVKALAASLAGLGAGVCEGNLESASAGTWVNAVAKVASGKVTPVDTDVKSPPRWGCTS
jgi:hypothetical protein